MSERPAEPIRGPIVTDAACGYHGTVITEPSHPHAQAKYEVRFDWGIEGAQVVVPGVGMIVLVDTLSAAEDDRAEVPAALAAFGRPVIFASLRNRTAVARRILAMQIEAGERLRVAVIAAGEVRRDGTIRFAVEDLLGAGAVVDALAEVGIDYCSPEAAAASAVFTGLKGAREHVLTASASGQELIAAGSRRDVEFAGELDVSTSVSVLGEFGYHA